MMHGEPFTGSLVTSRRLPGQMLWIGSFGLVPVTPGTITATPTPAQKPASQEPAPLEEVEALKAAETDPASTTVAGLTKLARSEHAGVAARATWLLRQRESGDARTALAELATTSDHAEVRVQALHALLRVGNAASATTAIDCLDDKDMRARTLAAQLLGKLRQPESAGPLLAMIAARAKIADKGSQSLDLQAALLALVDMGVPEHLLPAATALDDCRVEGFGPALTYYFQTHSTALDAEDQITLLVAVLGHSEPTLRRYAIGRLSEARDLTTVKALEGRLAAEGPELRPLIELALTQIRRQQPAGDAPDATATGEGLLAQAKSRWNTLSSNQRWMIGGLAGLCLLLFVAIVAVVGRRRRSRRALAADTASLAAPSEEYLEDIEAESQALAEAADELIDDAVARDPEDGYESDEFETDGEYAETDEEAEWQALETGAEDETHDEPAAEEPVLQDDDSFRS